MLPMLEVHFGNDTLHIPQNKKLNLIMAAYGKDTLKENILKCYFRRASLVTREAGIDSSVITLKDVEDKLISELKKCGDSFVFNQVVWAAKAKMTVDTLRTPCEWLSDEEEQFEDKIE